MFYDKGKILPGLYRCFFLLAIVFLVVFLIAFFFGLDTARRVKLFKVLRGPFPLVVFLLLEGIVVVEEVLRVDLTIGWPTWVRFRVRLGILVKTYIFGLG
jgi:hypothetical protein